MIFLKQRPRNFQHVIARLTRERDEARSALGAAAKQQNYAEQPVVTMCAFAIARECVSL